jgi:iron complex outermembrane receptor protein
MASGAASAQTAAAPATPPAAAGGVGEVVVTATRRSQNLQDVPISTSVITSATLEAMGTAGQDVRELAFSVPSLNIESSNGRTFPRFYIRGYGNTDFTSFASQPVSLVYDDIVQENPALKGFPIFDVSDVEVLRGPQGTLFGRNTPAGVVKVDSARPNFNGVSGYYNISEGTYNTANLEAVANLPLTDTIATRISIQEQHRDDWVSDPINNSHLEGYDDVAGRGQLLWQPNGDFSALFNVHGRFLNGSARLFRGDAIQQGSDQLINGFDPSKFYAEGANAQNYGSVGANAHLTWKQGDITYSSITGYETILHYFTKGDIDGGYYTPNTLPFGQNFIGYPGDALGYYFPVETSGGIVHHDQVTQEFRAASSYSGPLNWQAGVYLFDENVTAFSDDYSNVTSSFDPTGAITTGTNVLRQRNNAEAVYGSLDYKITSKLRVSVGLRETWDSKSFNVLSQTGDESGLLGPYTKKGSASRTNWDVSPTYALTPDANLYARVATGFRSFSFGAPTTTESIQVAKPEDVTSYETGVKTYLFDRKARLDFDVYYFDVHNQQLTAVGGNVSACTTIIACDQTQLLNARKTEGSGAELDLEVRPIEHLVLTFGGAYNHTRIEDPNLSVAVCADCTVTNPTFVNGAGTTVARIDGNPLPQAPKVTGDWTLRYSVPVGAGEVYFFTDWSYRSKIEFFLYKSVEFDGPALLQGGMRLGYKWNGGKYDVALYCRNCTNQIVAVSGIDFDNLTAMINDPVIYGVQFGGKF